MAKEHRISLHEEDVALAVPGLVYVHGVGIVEVAPDGTRTTVIAVGGGGGSGPPFEPTPGNDVFLVKDSSGGHTVIQAGDDTSGAILRSLDGNSFIEVNNNSVFMKDSNLKILDGVIRAKNLSPIQVLFNARYQINSEQAIIPCWLLGDGTTGGQPASGVYTDAPRKVAAAGHVVLGTEVLLETSGEVEFTADQLDLEINIFVTDLTGTNVARLFAGGFVASPVTDTTHSLDASAATWAISSGADLSDDGGGNLKTTAGGVFVVQYAARVNWD